MGKVNPENLSQQMKDFIAYGAQEAARIAIHDFQAQQDERDTANRDYALYNTRLLLANYHRLKHHAESAVTRLEDLEAAFPPEIAKMLFYGGETRLESLVEGKRRTIIMMAHFDTCLQLVKDEYLDEPEKWQALYLYYISDTYKGMKKTQRLEMVAEDIGCSERTARNWINELTLVLSCYLWGIDGLRAINRLGDAIANE